jgi:hypothetical protein
MAKYAVKAQADAAKVAKREKPPEDKPGKNTIPAEQRADPVSNYPMRIRNGPQVRLLTIYESSIYAGIVMTEMAIRQDGDTRLTHVDEYKGVITMVFAREEMEHIIAAYQQYKTDLGGWK